jgi:hypothetical protein
MYCSRERSAFRYQLTAPAKPTGATKTASLAASAEKNRLQRAFLRRRREGELLQASANRHEKPIALL